MPTGSGSKLKKLLNFGEQNGEFWAPMPGAERSTQYPSTVAYIATLLLHRYKVLGILDDEGRAIQSRRNPRAAGCGQADRPRSGADQGQGVPELQRSGDDQARRVRVLHRVRLHRPLQLRSLQHLYLLGARVALLDCDTLEAGGNLSGLWSLMKPSRFGMRTCANVLASSTASGGTIFASDRM